MSILEISTDKLPQLVDPFDVVEALCDADEWDLARKLAKKEDERRGERNS